MAGREKSIQKTESRRPKSVAAQQHRPTNRYREAAMVGDLRKDLATNAMDIQLGGNVARPPATLTSAEVPKDIQRAQKVAFSHFEDNFLVRSIVLGKRSFFNYGCRILVKGKPPSKSILKSWQNLWDEYAENCNGALMGTVMDGVRRYIDAAWLETLTFDSIVSVHQKSNSGFFPLPFTIQPFRCEYTDEYGYPKLKIETDWQKQAMPSAGDNYNSGLRKMDLKDQPGLRWKVMTRGPFGYGFGRPGMASIFRPLGQCASMEAGESLVGYLARTPLRQHIIGHETRYGPYAGGSQNFSTVKRSKEISKWFKGITGFAEFVSNFDQKLMYHWIDPKWFDAEKWGTIIQRVVWWAQSFGFMYITKSINPYLFPIFQQEAEQERADVKEHVETMLRHALDTDDLTVEWSNECFTDQRLGFEMMKFLTAQGPLSLGTALRKSGYDPEDEKERKLAEAEEKPAAFQPLFNVGGQGDKAGRPKGTPDPK